MKVCKFAAVLLLAVGMFSTTAIAAPEDDCVGAIPVPINSSSPVLFPCADTSPTGTDGSCVGFGLPQYAGTFDVWVSFVATQTTHRVRTDIGSVGSDTNYGVFSGGCGALAEVGCSEDEAAPFLGDICVGGLTIGDTYYVQLGAFCDGCFGACSPDGYVVTVQAPACGNSAVECDEQCDDGNTTPGDHCDANCRIEVVCGDGFLDAPEQCDDGNTADGDGCSANCTIEVVGVPAVSEWGLLVLVLIGLTVGTVMFGRRRQATA
jgi:cysteine-rich repeat protein